MDEYLALPDGAGSFPQGFSGPVVLRNPTSLRVLRLRDCHPLWCAFPDASTSTCRCRMSVLQPRSDRNLTGLGCSAFARHYLRNHYCFLFLRLLRCFSSPGSLQYPMYSGKDDPCGPGFPIRISGDQSFIASSPPLFAGLHVLHRL